MLGRKLETRSRAKTAKKAIGLILAVFASFGVAGIALAQAADQFGLAYGTYTGLTSTDPRILVANIIRIALGLLGIVAVGLILYAGFKWMTAQGDAKQVDEAKRILTQAVIGLLIIVSAYAIASFIINSLLGVGGTTGTTTGGGQDTTQCIGLSATCPSGALGSGIIESHYPGRGATNVPRNTRIIVTFKSKIDPASLTLGPAGTIAVIPSSDISSSSPRWADKFAKSAGSDAWSAVLTADGKTLALVQTKCSAATPDGCLGSPSANVFYTVALRGGTDGIKKADGSVAFAGTFANGYLWEFQVSTVLDLTPPTVVDVIPEDKSADNPRNTLIHLDFSEPIDPVSADAIAVTVGGGTVVKGENQIGNGYRTVEFRTDDECGINSCGETIYCLPGNAKINVAVKACGLSATPPTGVYPPNGITDMAGNSLDGNANGKAEGPPADDYKISFATNDTIDLTPPSITDQEPAANTGNIPRDLKISATFSKLMSATSLTTSTALLVPTGAAAPVNYSVTSENLTPADGGAPTQTKAQINHDLFGVDSYYSAAFTSGIRDLHQNCFYPSGGSTVCVGKNFCCNGTPANNENDWRAKCALP